MTHKKKILSLAKTRSKEAQDPIRKFILSISSPATLNGYKKSFAEFLRSVEEFDGTFEEMAMQFYEHAMSNPEEIQNILEDYAMYNSNRSREPTDSENYLNPSCFRNNAKHDRFKSDTIWGCCDQQVCREKCRLGGRQFTTGTKDNEHAK